jgi:hypothetical protein
MDASSIRAARALWDAGKSLEAGRVLFEAMPAEERPSWAGTILQFCCDHAPTVPAEVAAVLELTRKRSEWHRGHKVFDALRRLTLRIERNEVPADTMLRGIVGVAENVAKVTYNATSPADPFDADSGWWIVSNVYWILQRIADKAFSDGAWGVLSGEPVGQ